MFLHDGSILASSNVFSTFSRLTNASPFIEDDNQRDIRTRIAERQIDWTNLENANVSEEGWFRLATQPTAYPSIL
jgi:serine/threonine/tyrosine protein kinase RAD53